MVAPTPALTRARLRLSPLSPDTPATLLATLLILRPRTTHARFPPRPSPRLALLCSPRLALLCSLAPPSPRPRPALARALSPSRSSYPACAFSHGEGTRRGRAAALHRRGRRSGRPAAAPVPMYDTATRTRCLGPRRPRLTLVLRTPLQHSTWAAPAARRTRPQDLVTALTTPRAAPLAVCRQTRPQLLCSSFARV